MAANSILAQHLTACVGRGRGSLSERLVGGRDAFFWRPTLSTRRRRRIACHADEPTRKRPPGDDDSTAGIQLYSQIERLLIENPVQRLGATGAGEVKSHPFFRNTNWDMITRQKAAFIPSTEGEDDTSYFACRHPWNTADDHIHAASHDYDDMTDTCSMSCSSSPHSWDLDEDGDEFGSMADFGARTLSVKYSFSNFSFKNLSQLASMNYDLITKCSTESADASKP